MAAEAKLDTIELIMRNMLKTQIQNKETGRPRSKSKEEEYPDFHCTGEWRARQISEWMCWKNPLRKTGNSWFSWTQHRKSTQSPCTETNGSSKTQSDCSSVPLVPNKRGNTEKGMAEERNYTNNQSIYVNHSYPIAIPNCYKQYNEAKRVLGEKRIHSQTPYPAKLHIFYKDEARLFQTAHEATKDMHDWGYAPWVITPRQDLMKILAVEPWCIAGRKETIQQEQPTGQATTISRLQAFSRQRK